MNDGFETVLDLTMVRGGFDAGKCADDVWPWAVGGAATGGRNRVMQAVGFVSGAGAASLASPNCGENGRSPATILREGLTPGTGSGPRAQPSQPAPVAMPTSP
jgi:hypothetical protein